MGKAIIQSHLGDGLYRVKVIFDNKRIDARVAYVTQKITETTDEIQQQSAVLAEKQSALDTANQLLADYLQDTAPSEYASNPAELNRLTSEGFKAKADYDTQKKRVNQIQAMLTSLKKEKDMLGKYCPAEITADIWCVAYNTTLSGETKIIEIDYLLARDPATNQLRNDTGFWLPATNIQGSTTVADSILQHPLAGSEHSCWFNLAMAAAMQREKARYRVATLTSVNKSANKCNLTFDGQYSVVDSSVQLIDEKPIFPEFSGVQQQNYTDASIVYPPCHANVFNAGDRVIVDLNSGAGAPKVIGFYSHPKECWPYEIQVKGSKQFHKFFTVTDDLINRNFGSSTFTRQGVLRHPSSGNLYYFAYLHGRLYSVILDDDGYCIAYDDSYPYSSGNFYADIPAYFEWSAEDSGNGVFGDNFVSNYVYADGEAWSVYNELTLGMSHATFPLDLVDRPHDTGTESLGWDPALSSEFHKYVTSIPSPNTTFTMRRKKDTDTRQYTLNRKASGGVHPVSGVSYDMLIYRRDD